jgi:hypothetical protein
MRWAESLKPRTKIRLGRMVLRPLIRCPVSPIQPSVHTNPTAGPASDITTDRQSRKAHAATTIVATAERVRMR